MLACGASTIGWGTDIGGSIRIPAHMMGLYGLKPSVRRIHVFLSPTPLSFYHTTLL